MLILCLPTHLREKPTQWPTGGRGRALFWCILGNFFINRVAENILLEKKEKEGKRREKRGRKRGRKREKGGGRVGRVGRGVEKEVE